MSADPKAAVELLDEAELDLLQNMRECCPAWMTAYAWERLAELEAAHG